MIKQKITELMVTLHTEDMELDITPSALAVDTDKNLGAISGTFSLDVKPVLDISSFNLNAVSRKPFTSSDINTNQWMRWFKANDLVQISFSKTSSGERLYTMVGLIDTIHRVKSIDNNKKFVKTVRITGRDTGKILEKNHVTLLSNLEVDGVQLSGADEGSSPLAKYVNLREATRAALIAKIASGATAKKAVLEILEWYRGNFSNVEWKVDGYDYNMTMLLDWESRVRSYEGEFVQAMTIANSNGTLVDLLNQIAEKPFYEMFVDTKFTSNLDAGGNSIFKSELVVRPTQFSKVEQGTQWRNDQKFHRIEEDDILMQDLSKSDNEAYTAFKVNAAQPALQETSLNVIYKTNVVRELFERYGFNLMQVQSGHLVDGSKKYYLENDWPLAITKRNNLIKWYKYNDEFESGTVIIPIDDKIRIGEFVRIYGEEPYLFYTESVKQMWRFGQRTTTHLGLTRGLPIVKYNEYYPDFLFQFQNVVR